MTTEMNRTVAYLGPPCTYTHLACLERFGNSIKSFPMESIPDVFVAVERREVDCGVVPIENSTEGSVNRTLDMFIDSEVKICGEIFIRITHHLLSRRGDPGDIRKIYSHPQALEQCRRWLKEHYPKIPLYEIMSTAKAAEIATEDLEAAAVASSFAAELYGLKIIVSGIEDYPNNVTRFLILGNQLCKQTGKDKTSLLFSIPHSPGSLFRVLKPFDEKGINLTKIESRPVKDKPWEYIFFLDFEGHVADVPIHETLDQIKKSLLFMKILGSYPRGS